jgi:hypothetical protein
MESIGWLRQHENLERALLVIVEDQQEFEAALGPQTTHVVEEPNELCDVTQEQAGAFHLDDERTRQQDLAEKARRDSELLQEEGCCGCGRRGDVDQSIGSVLTSVAESERWHLRRHPDTGGSDDLTQRVLAPVAMVVLEP